MSYQRANITIEVIGCHESGARAVAGEGAKSEKFRISGQIRTYPDILANSRVPAGYC